MRLVIQNGFIELEPSQLELLIAELKTDTEAASVTYAATKAEQDALSTVYTLIELGSRLKCGRTKARELLIAYETGQEGGIRCRRIGNKYIVSEQAVREWLGDLPAAKG